MDVTVAMAMPLPTPLILPASPALLGAARDPEVHSTSAAAAACPAAATTADGALQLSGYGGLRLDFAG